MRKLTDVTNKNTEIALDLGGVGRPKKHESADKHVSGSAIYIDDRPEPMNLVHAAVGKSTIAHGKLISMDLSAVKAAEGVIGVYTFKDVPGHTDIGPVFPGDPILVDETIEFLGQPLFVVVATSHDLARKASKLVKAEYQALTPVLKVKDALAQKSFVRPPMTMKRGDSATAIKQAKHQLQGEISIGGQEHFYLEGQISTAEPTEEGGMLIYSSTQHPGEVQKLVAEVLDIPFNKVTVDTRRMGGGFGGKETQAAPWACLAALCAHKTKRPVKFKLSRPDDMELTGKRHPFENSYHVGFNEEGVIEGIDLIINGNCGYSPDLSDAIVDRAMFHSDNAYYLANATVTGNRCKTNTVSHTAYRGFGGPQGVMTIEKVMDDIAGFLSLDPLTVRLRNLYGAGGNASEPRNMTHYHQEVEHNNLETIFASLIDSSDYHARRKQVDTFNAENPVLKKGLALTPVKFGISFTAKHLNQAGALVNIYTDGSILVNHGGTEMGQGLNTKVAQIIAEEFQIDVDNVGSTATRTDKVPNASPTAASSGTDLNGKAAQNAAITIRNGLVEFACEHFKVTADQVRFESNQVIIDADSGEQTQSFAEFIQLAYFNRVSLSSTGFYKTPKIHFDRETGQGRPFFYFSNGAAVSEVVVDTLTGEYKILRTDILHDVGTSLNPAIDIGQIEGAFVQGAGWMTTEELMWNEQGRLLSNNPATYKIPAISDAPEDFRVNLLPNEPNAERTIYNSKAVGEPPFMLGISVWSALRDAISSLSPENICPELDTPATPERVLMAIEQLNQSAS